MPGIALALEKLSLGLFGSVYPPTKHKLSGKQRRAEGGAPHSQPDGSLPHAPPLVTMTTGDSSPDSPVSFR